jgi:hypothetical protein
MNDIYHRQRLATKLVTVLYLLVCSAVFSSAAAAAEAHGVSLPDAVVVEGRRLALNGMGARTKTFLRIKVYVAGLYLESPTKDAARILATDGPRQIVLRVTHDTPRPRLRQELLDGLQRSTKLTPRTAEERVDQLLAQVPALKEGDVLALTYLPGQGTRVEAAGRSAGLVPGKEFADAIFSVWLGANPLDEDLKRALLQRK